MNVQEVKRQVRLREWAEQINDCKQSGLTVKAWCKENGVYIKTYYNRMKKVREELLDAMGTGDPAQLPWKPGVDWGVAPCLTGPHGEQTSRQLETSAFVAIPMPRRRDAAVTVQIGSHIAEVHNGADAETVEGVLRTLVRL